MDGLSLRRRIALDIARSMRKSQEEEHPLRQLFWECTLRCNLRCQHCGSDCKQVAATPDMPKEDFFKVLDSIAAKTDPHKVFVIISGGEPTAPTASTGNGARATECTSVTRTAS